MTKITVSVQGATARARCDGDLTAKAVGIPIQFTFDSVWDNLAKTGYARCGNAERKIVLDGEGKGIVPWECLISGAKLYVGVNGAAISGGVMIPTVWAYADTVKPSVAESEAGSAEPAPTPTQVDLITNVAQSADQKASEAKEAAITAQNSAKASAEDAAESAAEAQRVLDEIPPSYEEIVKMVDDYIIVSENQPTEKDNEVWVDPNTKRIGVPTEKAFNKLSESVGEMSRAVIGERHSIEMSQEVVNIQSWRPEFPCRDIATPYTFRVDFLTDGYTKIFLYGITESGSTVLLKNLYIVGEEIEVAEQYSAIRVYAMRDEKATGKVDVSFIPPASGGLIREVEDLKNVNLKGKKVSILGVSIDTYGGWIPDENVAYYTDGKAQLPNGVNDTWWKKVLDKTGATLLKNNAYTGSCAATSSDSYATSGVARCTNLSDTAEEPDIILVGQFAANDWTHSECGTWDMSMSDLLAGTDVDLAVPANYETYKSVTETYAGAMATIFYRLQEKYPNARIFALDMYNFTRSNGKNPPRRSATNKTTTIALYNKALNDVADYFGVTVIHAVNCGITAKNSERYTVEGMGATANLHPNADGHALIYRSVMIALKNAYGF